MSSRDAATAVVRAQVPLTAARCCWISTKERWRSLPTVAGCRPHARLGVGDYRAAPGATGAQDSVVRAYSGRADGAALPAHVADPGYGRGDREPLITSADATRSGKNCPFP